MSTSITITKPRQRNGGDQARSLREMIARRATADDKSVRQTRRCHTIVVTGGKGGVGRSVIALNLAVTLAQRGDSVGLLDACSTFGNIELLCGLNGYWNLSHVIQGCRQLQDVIHSGPAGVKIVSGASSLCDPSYHDKLVSGSVNDQLQMLERELDWLIVDASGGTSAVSKQFGLVGDDTLIVAIPESTSVTEAYSSIKSFGLSGQSRLGLLVNQADSVPQANQILDRLQQAAHSFLQIDLHRRGSIPRDDSIPRSVNERIPFVLQSPKTPATLELSKLAGRFTRKPPSIEVESFFLRLQRIIEK